MCELIIILVCGSVVNIVHNFGIQIDKMLPKLDIDLQKSLHFYVYMLSTTNSTHSF